MFAKNETLEDAIIRNVNDALFEDIGKCDWTAHLIPATQQAQAKLIVRESAVLCGSALYRRCLDDPKFGCL
jgi:nicotinate-nucleotide pyrophosphorylase (carboxylating)